ncbi:MAG: glycine C-acetyltransferase, partial [Cyclobacteriaceae bacterium]
MDLFEKLLQNKGALGSHSDIDDNFYMFPKLEGE